MKFKYFVKITFIFITLLCVSINGQSKLENSFTLLSNQLSNAIINYDSLNSILNERVRIINVKKNNSEFDQNEITKLLSKTAGLTNNLDLLQNKIDSLEKRILEVKNGLIEIYTLQIDSLKNSNLSVNEKKAEVIKLIEKRLIVSPKIEMLSFSPRSILNLPQPQNEVEEKLYYENLTTSYNEVENKINEIAKLKNELKRITELNNEAKDFLEDIDFENNYAVYTNPKSSSQLAEVNNPDEKNHSLDASNSLRYQSQSFSEILYQFGHSNSFNLNTFLGSDSKNNLESFDTLMNAVEKQLNDYSIIISNKLKSKHK